MIGLDSATFDIINPLIKNGKLPNIAKLIKEGISGTLLTTIPSVSHHAWSSFATGKNAGKHGVYTYVETIPNSYHIRFVNASSRKAKAIWSILSESSKKVGVINMPVTYPPDKVNGFMISGMDTPGIESDFTYPIKLKKEILEEFGSYTIDYSFLGSVNKSTGKKILTSLFKVEEKRVEVAKYLMNKYDWDFFFIVLVALDRVQHFFWHFMEKKHPRYNEAGAELFRDAIYDMYEKMDILVGRLIGNLESNVTIMLMSDHGAGPYDQSLPYLDLNEWLNINGYLNLKNRTSNKSSGKAHFNHKVLNFLWGFRKFLRKTLPSVVRQKLKALFPTLREKFHSHLYFSSIDWSNTKAYAPFDEFLAQSVKINLKGREPEGIIEQREEYEDLREELSEKISTFRHPRTNEPVVSKVYKREELYKGNHLDKAPDLIIEWDDKAFFSEKNQEKEVNKKAKKSGPTDISISGSHRQNGILIAKGHNIKKGEKIDRASIMDLTPTILYLMGQSVENDMDGKVLTKIFLSPYLRKYPIQYKDIKEKITKDYIVYSEEEAKKIEEKLKGLGYIE